MARVIELGSMGPQSPIFGIRHENIVPRLTAENWQHKAVVRLAGDQLLYLYIARGTTSGENGKKLEVFCVQAYSDNAAVCEYEARLVSLEAALRYINGDDDGKLARETLPANPDQYPMQQGPEVILNSIRR